MHPRFMYYTKAFRKVKHEQLIHNYHNYNDIHLDNRDIQMNSNLYMDQLATVGYTGDKFVGIDRNLQKLE